MPEPKEGVFNQWFMGDLCDELHQHSHVLEALSELIASSSMTGFSNENRAEEYSANRRWGIQQIIELYLDQQKRILDEYMERFHNFDLVILEKGKNQLESVLKGVYIKKADEVEPLKKAIEYLDIIIERGGDFTAEAVAVKGECKDYLNSIGF